MWRRAALIAVTVLAVTRPDAALAASVTPTSRPVGSAHASVSPCGTLSGIGVSWTSTANVVTAVVLTSIPVACTGATLSVTLVGAGSASLASIGPVTITGTSQTFSTLTGSATATSVTGAYVSAVGP